MSDIVYYAPNAVNGSKLGADKITDVLGKTRAKLTADATAHLHVTIKLQDGSVVKGKIKEAEAAKFKYTMLDGTVGEFPGGRDIFEVRVEEIPAPLPFDHSKVTLGTPYLWTLSDGTECIGRATRKGMNAGAFSIWILVDGELVATSHPAANIKSCTPFYSNVSSTGIRGNSPPNPDQWHAVAQTWKKDAIVSMHITVNGAQMEQRGIVVTPATTTRQARIRWDNLGVADFPPPPESGTTVVNCTVQQSAVDSKNSNVYTMMANLGTMLNDADVTTWYPAMSDPNGSATMTIKNMLTLNLLKPFSKAPMTVQSKWRDVRQNAFSAICGWIDTTAIEIQQRFRNADLEGEGSFNPTQQIAGQLLLDGLQRANFGYNGGNVDKYDLEMASAARGNDVASRARRKAGNITEARGSARFSWRGGRGRRGQSTPQTSPGQAPASKTCRFCGTALGTTSFQDHNKVCRNRRPT